MEPEGPVAVRDTTDPEGVWDYTVHHFRGHALRNLGVAPRAEEAIQSFAAAGFLERLEAAGLITRRERRRVMIGYAYGTAGALMRAAQTEFIDADKLSQSAKLMPRWPYREFVNR
jgi:hypothetical protein